MKNAARALLVALLGLVAPQWLQASPFAYVTHQNGVSVIDLGIMLVVNEIPLAGAGAVAVQPTRNRAYVGYGPRIAIIDTNARAHVGDVAIPTNVERMALHPTLPQLWARTGNCPSDGQPCPAVFASIERVIDTDTLSSPSTSFTMMPPKDLQFRADGIRAYSGGFGSLDVIDVRPPMHTLSTIAYGDSTFPGIAVESSGRFVYAPENKQSETGNTVAVIDTEAGAVVGRVTVGTNPINTVLNASGTRLFVANKGSNSVSVIDTATRTVVGTIAVGSRPMGMDLTPDGDILVVVNSGDGSVSIVNIAAMREVRTIGVGPSPTSLGRFIIGSSAAVFPDLLTGLWWNPAEPGWGVHVTQRGNKIFAAWFTYNGSGAPKWFVSSDCVFNGTPPSGADFRNEVSCSGNIYDTNGPRFFSDPYNPGAVVTNKLGFFQMSFTDRNTGGMSVGIGNAVKSMPLKRQIFSVNGPSAPVDYTDLWWNPAESGWGMGITQQPGVMFLSWFAYDDTGTPTWYVASNCAMNANGNGCTGTLYRTSGPIDPLRNPFDPSKVKVTAVGSITASFGDNNSGTISYTVDGKAGTKSITRQLF